MTEYNECVSFVSWLKWQKVKYSHIVNENTIHNPAYIGKLKRMGWNSGIPDYIITIPQEVSKYDRTLLLFVEMKQCKKQLKRKSLRGEKGDYVSVNDLSDNQIEWINTLKQVADVEATCCYGSDEAIEFVSNYLKQTI